MEAKGLIFDIQRFSTGDGAGIRTTVFLKGCPLRCLWCHNIESQDFDAQIAYYSEDCLLCGACASVCPSLCHKIEDGVHTFERKNCAVCGKCTQACMCGALLTTGKYMTVSEVMERVMRDKLFYGTTGGLTVSGGEPIAQFEFTYALAKAARECDISFMIETSGFGKRSNFEALVPLCDGFLFDIKASGERHSELVGVEDTQILKNLDAIYKLGANIILRVPVIPDANIDASFVQKLKGLIKKYPKLQGVEFMPYHKIGISKAERYGLSPQKEYTVPSAEYIRELKSQIGLV